MKLGVYLHYKGAYYLVIGVARDSTDGPTGMYVGPRRDMVVYIGLTEKPGPRTFVRERTEFEGKTKDGQQRFAYVGDEIPPNAPQKEPPK